MGTETAAKRAATAALVTIRGLSKQYLQRSPFSRKKFVVDALIDVDLEIAPACLTALVGESGSGKSTLARCLAMLETPDRGKIWFEGNGISCCNAQQSAHLRPKIQLVFQDSAGALNPRFSAGQIIAEPLEIQGREIKKNLRSRARELMEEVGLSPDWIDRRPLEFSGGQRQRLAIARAIALRPTLLVLDESLSGLDLSTQAQILNLLLDLQATHSLTCLLISHDLSLVGQVADFVAVMHQGSIVEQGTRQAILTYPRHAHTRQLLDSCRVIESTFRTAQAGGRS
ncbi:MAG TPA: ABC transporter ATP-binding protein [Terriglobales bacterium]|jgi:ABC-type glutathione transport system ATPase component|nr:ABC transporter ATP-binding protein [Terriglobales bacterium]